tara:strand:+ start:2311 stop:3069 length:759 start_codon:yes stop_codon:yes gene_type:complete
MSQELELLRAEVVVRALQEENKKLEAELGVVEAGTFAAAAKLLDTMRKENKKLKEQLEEKEEEVSLINSEEMENEEKIAKLEEENKKLNDENNKYKEAESYLLVQPNPEAFAEKIKELKFENKQAEGMLLIRSGRIKELDQLVVKGDAAVEALKFMGYKYNNGSWEEEEEEESESEEEEEDYKSFGVMNVDEDGEDDLGFFDTKKQAIKFLKEYRSKNTGLKGKLIVFVSAIYNPDYDSGGTVSIVKEYSLP